MLIRRAARPMIASVFFMSAVKSLRNPQASVAESEPVAKKIREKSPIQLPEETETLIRIDGLVKLTAGSLFALGKFPRVAALVLATSLIPATMANHRYWEIQDSDQRADQRWHFFKNVALFGGLLIAAADTEGRPSLRWRASRASKRAAATVSNSTHEIADTARSHVPVLSR